MKKCKAYEAPSETLSIPVVRIVPPKQQASTKQTAQVSTQPKGTSQVVAPSKSHSSITEVRNVLAADPALDSLRYDLLQHRFVVTGTLPWPRHDKNWSEADFASLQAYLEAAYEIRGAHNIHAALLSYLTECKAFNPFLDYLTSLPPWDGTKRLSYTLQIFLGAQDNPYTQVLLRKVLVAIIRRVRSPEPVKFDNMLVLNGPQGIGKSMFLSKLAGKWFTDSLTLRNMCDKSGYEIIQGKILAEVPELAGIERTRMEDVKRFLSSYEDTYRAPYALQAVTRKRITVLVGTVNATQNGFLRDITGNRRFWPVKCSDKIACPVWKLAQEDIDLMWAEAYHYELQGESLMLTAEQEEYAAKARQDNMEADETEGLIESYLLSHYYTDDHGIVHPPDGINRLELWVHALGRELSTYNPRRDGACLTRNMLHLGWQEADGTILTEEFGRQRYFIKAKSPSAKPQAN